MKKMIILLAASLMTSSFVFAEPQSPANANDVIHSIPARPGIETESSQPITVADANTPMPAMDASTPAKTKQVTHHKKTCKKSCKKSCKKQCKKRCKTHCKKVGKTHAREHKKTPVHSSVI